MVVRPKWIIGGAIAVITLLVVAGTLVQPSKPITATESSATKLSPAPKVGHPAPPFTLSDMDGKKVRLEQYRGRVVLINFFATWCVPCRSELPAINRVYRAHQSDLVVLAVDKQEPESDVRRFATEHSFAFSPLLDPELTVWQRYGVSIQPMTFWIDRNGIIRSIRYAMDESVIRREFRRLAT